MALIINTNIASLNAQKNLSRTQNALDKSIARLSSGLRINSAKDDAAGMAISNRFVTQIRGFSQAIRNANDGISLLQTSEGSMQEVTSILQRMRELAVQAANDTNSASDRASLQGEMDQLFAEIDRIAGTTQFNGIQLVDGSGGALSFQIGSDSGQTVTVELKSVKTSDLNLNGYSKVGELNSGRIGTSMGGASGLTINGFAIGSAATTGTAADAAKAINQKTSNTGVSAVAYNIYKGTGNVSGIVSGLKIGTSSGNLATIENSGSMTELVNNINRDAAGVSATLNKDGSITLSNDTGLDIVVGGTPDNSGLSAEIYKGYIALTDDKNEPISITASSGCTSADVNEWGFNISTGSTSITGGQVTTDKIAAGDLTINGVSVGASTGSSAGDKAAAINLVKGSSGVSASAYTEVSVSVDTTKIATASDLKINGSVVNLSAATSMKAVVTTINNSVKGIVATTSPDGKLILTASSGMDIEIVDLVSVMEGSKTTRGTIVLTSDTGADIQISGMDLAKVGFTEQGGSSEAIGSGLNIMSLENASNAIDRIDDAIDMISANRADLGAVQNRLDSTISNLQNASENFSASNSRLIDADFAAETAEMSKQQIMMQAGVAMLAQAKQLPQQALSLLQQ
ncbi:MAG: flagellin [Desulfatirhabdiaceae bacterium]